MNKKVLILSFLFSTISYSSDFVSIINQDNNQQYTVVNTYTKYEFNGFGTLNISEHCIVWVDFVWVK